MHRAYRSNALPVFPSKGVKTAFRSHPDTFTTFDLCKFINSVDISVGDVGVQEFDDIVEELFVTRPIISVRSHSASRYRKGTSAVVSRNCAPWSHACFSV